MSTGNESASTGHIGKPIAIVPATCQINIESPPSRPARQDIWSGYDKSEKRSASQAQEQAREHVRADAQEGY